MTEELKQLGAIIAKSIDSIVNVCELRNMEFPSLLQPAQPTEFTKNGIRNDPVITDAIALGVAAATQLVATLQPPHITLMLSSSKVCCDAKKSSLRMLLPLTLFNRLLCLP